MAAYAQIVAGAVANIVEWDGSSAFPLPDGVTMEPLSALPAGVGIGWTLSGSTWSPPAAPAQINWTFLQFMTLFAPVEQAAIVSSTDPQIKLFLLMAAGAGTIQLSNPEVIGGVGYLVSASLLTSARASAILAGQAPS